MSNFENLYINYKCAKAGKEALWAFGEGDELRMMLVGLRRFTKMEPFNVKQARQNVAMQVIEANKYVF
ncbi:hypothetical protein [Pedobacter helvus]